MKKETNITRCCDNCRFEDVVATLGSVCWKCSEHGTYYNPYPYFEKKVDEEEAADIIKRLDEAIAMYENYYAENKTKDDPLSKHMAISNGLVLTTLKLIRYGEGEDKTESDDVVINHQCSICKWEDLDDMFDTCFNCGLGREDNFEPKED